MKGQKYYNLKRKRAIDVKMKAIIIGNRLVGGNNLVFIVAEVPANHVHDYKLAL